MTYGRDEYNKLIQQADKSALRDLFGRMLNCMSDVAVNDETTYWFRQQFEAAIAETIPANEPVFLIRGQDQVGAAAVRAWAHLHQVNGGSDVAYMAAMRQADRMEAWPKKKKADIPTPPAEETDGR